MPPLAAVQKALQAYLDKDRDAIEGVIADHYRFTSPLDNGIDRATYFELCWPNSASMTAMNLLHSAEQGEYAFVVYEGEMAGKRVRHRGFVFLDGHARHSTTRRQRIQRNRCDTPGLSSASIMAACRENRRKPNNPFSPSSTTAIARSTQSTRSGELSIATRPSPLGPTCPATG